MEEERNELLEQETNEGLESEENQTPVATEDHFGAGLIIGGGVVTLVMATVKVAKKLRNNHKTKGTDSDKVTKVHWYDRFKRHAEPEETDEPIDVKASVKDSEDEEE